MRMYRPRIGDLVKLRRIEHYTTLRQEAPELAIWSWFRVLNIGSEEELTARVQHYNAGITGLAFDVQLDWIDPPLGWKSQYDIVVDANQQFGAKTAEEMAQSIRSDWFSRGVAVWISHEVSMTPEYAFTPLVGTEVQNPGHWKYTPNPVEVIPASECEDTFRIMLSEEFLPELPPSKCRKEREEAVAALREQGYIIEKFDGETWARKDIQFYPELTAPEKEC